MTLAHIFPSSIRQKKYQLLSCKYISQQTGSTGWLYFIIVQEVSFVTKVVVIFNNTVRLKNEKIHVFLIEPFTTFHLNLPTNILIQ